MNNTFEIPSCNGRFITHDEARNNCSKPILLGKIKGHLFDLEKFEELVTRIQEHNQRIASSPDDQKIKHVRIYYSRSTRRGGQYPNKKDLVLVPVLGSGDDLYDVKVAGKESKDIILSESTPCPNLCGKKKVLNCPE